MKKNEKTIRLKIARVSMAGLVAMICSSRIVYAASVDPSILTMPRTQAPSSVDDLTTLSGAFDESLLNSPRAAHLRAQLGISKAAYAQALTLPNPSFFFL